MDVQEAFRPESYLILYNIMKSANFGYLLRTATAFGVAEVVIVGKRAFDIGGACGTTRRTPKRHFHTLAESREYFRARRVDVCGVEIHPDATPIHRKRFFKPTAFMVGNEASGLTPMQLDFCDYLVYVPQYGNAACLNVNVAAGIALHHFAIQVSYSENARNGTRFKLQGSGGCKSQCLHHT